MPTIPLPIFNRVQSRFNRVQFSFNRVQSATTLLLGAFIALLSAPLHAQQPKYSFSANVVNPRITVGEWGAVEFRAIGGEPDEQMPQRIAVQGLDVVYTSSQFFQNTKIINGQLSRELTYTYYYKVVGQTPGTYEIPAIPVSIRGNKVTSQPVKVVVSDQKASPINPTSSRFAQLELPDTPIYEKQIFPIDATIYVAGHNAINKVVGAELKHESFVIKRFERMETAGVELQGNVFSTAKLPTTMYSLKAGKHKLGPGQFSVRVYEQSRSFLGMFTKERTVASNIVDLEVLPLPSGAPQSFTGGVGQFQMQASATPTELKVGDPISVEFAVTGIGNFETMNAPVVSGLDPKVWKTYKSKKVLDKESDGINTGRTLFTQVLIPLEVVDRLPTFELSYFDPESAKYVTHQSPETRLTVQPDAAPTLINPGMASTTAGGTPTQPSAPGPIGAFPTAAATGPIVPMAQFSDVMHIRKGAPNLKAYSAQTRPWLAIGIVNGLVGAGIVALGSFLVVGKVRERRLAKNITEKPLTYREASRLVKPGLSKDEFYQLTNQAFDTWVKENPDASTEQKDFIATLKSKCEDALYSNSADSSDQTISSAEADEYIAVLKKLS